MTKNTLLNKLILEDEALQAGFKLIKTDKHEEQKGVRMTWYDITRNGEQVGRMFVPNPTMGQRYTYAALGLPRLSGKLIYNGKESFVDDKEEAIKMLLHTAQLSEKVWRENPLISELKNKIGDMGFYMAEPYTGFKGYRLFDVVNKKMKVAEIKLYTSMMSVIFPDKSPIFDVIIFDQSGNKVGEKKDLRDVEEIIDMLRSNLSHRVDESKAKDALTRAEKYVKDIEKKKTNISAAHTVVVFPLEAGRIYRKHLADLFENIKIQTGEELEYHVTKGLLVDRYKIRTKKYIHDAIINHIDRLKESKESNLSEGTLVENSVPDEVYSTLAAAIRKLDIENLTGLASRLLGRNHDVVVKLNHANTVNRGGYDHSSGFVLDL